jgi:hypothetical protein
MLTMEQETKLAPFGQPELDSDVMFTKWLERLAFWERWFEYIGLGNAVSDPTDPHGFYDKPTGEAMCPFRAVPCLGSKCNWWEPLVKPPDIGHGYKYECWFWLRKYSLSALSGLYSDCPTVPAEVMAMLRSEGYGTLPALAP